MSSTASLVPLKATEVTKSFHQGSSFVTALNGVSLDVQKGEFVAIMGASGSGKSTLLHVMAGLTRPDSGVIRIEGQNLSELSDSRLTDFRRRRVGIVFQQFNLIPSLTALENVMLPLMVELGRQTSESREAAQSLLESLGLGHRMEHRPDSMSGGEQQRVAIARALVADPAIILADEPTGSLDSANGHALCSLLKELNETEGRTIVVVTHEPSVAAWANRVVVMKDGSICREWRSEEVPDAQALALRYQELVCAPKARA
ncbi:ABC transporter ATP-binding protein [Lacunimicrobium album]